MLILYWIEERRETENIRLKKEPKEEITMNRIKVKSQLSYCVCVDFPVQNVIDLEKTESLPAFAFVSHMFIHDHVWVDRPCES